MCFFSDVFKFYLIDFHCLYYYQFSCFFVIGFTVINCMRVSMYCITLCVFVCYMTFCFYFQYPGDSVITGRGLINGRVVFLFSQVSVSISLLKYNALPFLNIVANDFDIIHGHTVTLY